MDLLIPETGTLVWMLIAFGIVFFALIKWGFPMITGVLEERREFIDKSLESAKEANAKLAGIQQECQNILEEARSERARILKEAQEGRDEIIAKAKSAAQAESEKMIADATERIRQEKEEAIRGIRREVAGLSVEIARKVLEDELSDAARQEALMERMIDNINHKE